tara:strand:- start:3918 stop:4067 length:150 start_codon:yes stop_codon:yes gene_type:complete
MLSLFKLTREDIATEKSANDPVFVKFLADMNQFRDGDKRWHENAFLPPG